MILKMVQSQWAPTPGHRHPPPSTSPHSPWSYHATGPRRPHHRPPELPRRLRTPSNCRLFPPASSTRLFHENRATPPCSAPPRRPHGARGQDLVVGQSPPVSAPPCAMHVVTTQSRRATPAERAGKPKRLTGRTNSVGTMGQSRPNTVPLFFFNFFYISRKSCKIQKCVENTIRLGKI
jgi:hypothetical protein